MADDSTYYIDVIRRLVEHPGAANATFLVKGAEQPGAAEAARLKQTSCDVHASVVCMRAWFGGYRLSRDFYEGDRAMRESGLRYQRPLRPILGCNPSLCAGGPQLPALSLRTRSGAHGAPTGKAAGRVEVGSARQRARQRHPTISLAAEERCFLRLRFHPCQVIQLRFHHFALSAMVGCGDTRRGEFDRG